jgi:hypothetical protein
MLNIVKSGFDGKLLTALLLAFLLFSTLLFSQSNTFRLGYTGMYPHRFDYTSSSGVNWLWHEELNINTWQGWWI